MRSASSIIDSAIRSLIEAPGLARSDLIQTSASPNRRLMRMCGVLPIVSRMLAAFMAGLLSLAIGLSSGCYGSGRAMSRTYLAVPDAFTDGRMRRGRSRWRAGERRSRRRSMAATAGGGRPVQARRASLRCVARSETDWLFERLDALFARGGGGVRAAGRADRRGRSRSCATTRAGISRLWHSDAGLDACRPAADLDVGRALRARRL